MKRLLGLTLCGLLLCSNARAEWVCTDPASLRASRDHSERGMVSAVMSGVFLAGALSTAAHNGHVKAFPQGFLMAGGLILGADSARWFLKARADLRGVAIGYRFR